MIKSVGNSILFLFASEAEAQESGKESERLAAVSSWLATDP